MSCLNVNSAYNSKKKVTFNSPLLDDIIEAPNLENENTYSIDIEEPINNRNYSYIVALTILAICLMLVVLLWLLKFLKN